MGQRLGAAEDGESTLLVAFVISPVSIFFLNGLLLERFIRGVSPHHPITPSYPPPHFFGGGAEERDGEPGGSVSLG